MTISEKGVVCGFFISYPVVSMGREQDEPVHPWGMTNEGETEQQ